MGEEVIKTRVDDLIAFLEGKDKVPLLDAATALKVKPDTIQAWVDFLVEEGLLGIEYKFTKPFIYLNKSDHDKARIIGEEELTWETYRKAFLAKAEEKHIPSDKAQVLWKRHVLTSLEAKRQLFIDETRKRQLADAESLWNRYKAEVLVRI